jgi:hypothetical protein
MMEVSEGVYKSLVLPSTTASDNWEVGGGGGGGDEVRVIASVLPHSFLSLLPGVDLGGLFYCSKILKNPQ